MALDLPTQLDKCKNAAIKLRGVSSKEKNQVLRIAAELIESSTDIILAANKEDVRALASLDDDRVKTAAFQDRLLLDSKRLKGMADSLRAVAELPDPLEEAPESKRLANGLLLKRVRSPIGLIFMIFESRPNVALEAFSMAFKSGNGIILRGGKESVRTTTVLYALLHQALQSQRLPADILWGIENPDRTLVLDLLKQKKHIDLVVPRGGEGLIQFVEENSSIPIIKNDRGLCHVYVHADADMEMAARIVDNAKTQRPGVCNAMETLLVHESIKNEFLPLLHARLSEKRVEWHVCRESLKVLKGKAYVKVAGSGSWDTEYLDLKMNCKVVTSFEEALDHIEKHGSKHSECIVTNTELTAREFQSRVDAAAVYWNASTRFTDGYEFGLGGELGISTQKLHVRGPVGLRELTSQRWVIDGEGQVRS
jgi:glutamate-5-semialdehyde dehydrogenase